MVTKRTFSKTNSFYWLAALIGVAVVLLVANQRDWPPAIRSLSQQQGRLNTALPAPQADGYSQQTIRPPQDGFYEIELLVSRFNQPEQDGDGAIRIEVLNEQSEPVYDQQFGTKQLTHNQVFPIRFEPQVDSANQTYTLRISGYEGNQTSFWGYDLDTYGGGEATVVGAECESSLCDSAVKEFRFNTRYELQTNSALNYLADATKTNATLIFFSLLMLFLPGAALLSFSKKQWFDVPTSIGLSLALSLAVWPLIWFFLTLLGGRVTSLIIYIILILSVLKILSSVLDRVRFILHPSSLKLSFSLPTVMLFIILLVAFAVRFLAIRDVAFPPWVDASRHGLITALMSDNGRFITTYEPMLPVTQTRYHYGFHTIPANLILLTGSELRATLLFVGQFLNALTPVGLYAAAVILTRRKSAGLIAAFMVALPTYFPAYFLTWGRYTHMTALIMLPPLLALTWQLLVGAKGWKRTWWIFGILFAGIFYVHARVFAYYVPFLLVAGLLALVVQGKPSLKKLWQHNKHIGFGTLAAFVLVIPRVFQLNAVTRPASYTYSLPSYNEINTGYLTAGWETWIYYLAMGLLLLLGVYILFRRVYPWALFVFAMLLWIGALFGLLSGYVPYVPAGGLLTRDSVVISLFVPTVLTVGILLSAVYTITPRLSKIAGFLVTGILAGTLTAATLFGVHNQITIVNEVTLLGWQEDIAGIDWVKENLPPPSADTPIRIASSSWKWLNNTYAATDGGAWLSPLTGHQVTMPPIDHINDPDFGKAIRAFNQEAGEIEDWSGQVAVDFLRANDVTHIYVGAKGGFFDPAALSKNPELTLLYTENGVFIFGLNVLESQ